MSSPFPFHYLEPIFFSGLFDDPVLLVRIRPLGRSILLDCGQLHHLAKRELKSIDAIFVTHAHMDHFMGFDTFVRSVHVTPRSYRIFGPPGIGDRIEHRLAGYDWNLAEEYWCRFEAQEYHDDGRLHLSHFSGAEGFSRRVGERRPVTGGAIFDNRYLSVSATLCDHKIPVLALRIDERPAFSLDPERIARHNLEPGPWIGELKEQFFADQLGRAPLDLPIRGSGHAGTRREEDTAALYRRLKQPREAPSIGYLTDVGFTEANLERLRSLLGGVTVLLCECSFLEQEKDRARRSLHLCTEDLRRLCGLLRPRYLLPMHLSKNYQGRSDRLYDELDLPPGTTLLKLPDRRTPRPLIGAEGLSLKGLVASG